MGFFRDFKEDLSHTAGKAVDVGEIEVEAAEDDVMVNTLDESVSDDLSSLSASLAKELEQSVAEEVVVAEAEADLDEEDVVSDETALITAGLIVDGDMISDGSIDVLGSITGNVTCKGKLTVSGSIYGNSKAGSFFANSAEIEGNIDVKGAIKIGQGTVIVGDITAASAVIAGAVKGNVDVKGTVIVDSTAVIVGDIKSKSVQINNGAAIDGHCSQCYADVDTSAIFDIKTKKSN
ncbi:MAG: polymer-forming cytoskeletal protein [Lachnospira sp.]|nr:polymer-forming cytoskeletal protein [Lachnospira sp.]